MEVAAGQLRLLAGEACRSSAVEDDVATDESCRRQLGMMKTEDDRRSTLGRSKR